MQILLSILNIKRMKNSVFINSFSTVRAKTHMTSHLTIRIAKELASTVSQLHKRKERAILKVKNHAVRLRQEMRRWLFFCKRNSSLQNDTFQD